MLGQKKTLPTMYKAVWIFYCGFLSSNISLISPE